MLLYSSVILIACLCHCSYEQGTPKCHCNYLTEKDFLLLNTLSFFIWLSKIFSSSLLFMCPYNILKKPNICVPKNYWKTKQIKMVLCSKIFLNFIVAVCFLSAHVCSLYLVPYWNAWARGILFSWKIWR